jgi:23S rRNA (uracil1939-C5)-methyltransferase
MDITVTIDKMVHGGEGLCRTGGGVAFVSGALPGEKVRARIERNAGGAVHAVAVEILEPSAGRREPACRHFGTCGGCDWLHIRYKEQRAFKKDIFLECLKRIGKINELPAVEIVESPEFEYRVRAQFKLDFPAATAGFFGKRSNAVIPVAHCPILCKDLNGLLAALPSHMKKLPAGLLDVKAVCGLPGEATGSRAHVASRPVLEGLTLPSTIVEAGACRFFVDGGGFFQSNGFLSGRMGAWAREHLRGETVWDLYGGAGFFSVFLGNRFKNGVVVENDPDQARAARKNLLENGIGHFSVEARTAAGFLGDARKKGPKADCVVIDPPREGLQDEVLKVLSALAPPVILYVSCDPATQARDAGRLIRSCGYKIEKAALFDCYPQTHHLETMLLLSRPTP